MRLAAYVPLLIHPTEHFHFGVGPYFTMDLTSSSSVTTGGVSSSGDGSKDTTIGLRGEIAGWL